MYNVFYQLHINCIGGIETFLYELARLSYKHKRDLTIVYRSGDPIQIARIRKYCRIVSLAEIEKPIKCHKAFFNYAVDAIDLFEADEYIQIIHADFKSDILQGWIHDNPQSDKITTRYAVSANNKKSYEEVTNYIVKDVLYNPICIEDEPRVMTLVSAQRMSPEKGVNRIKTLVKMLDNAKIPYVWHIFADKVVDMDSENVMFHKTTLDVRKWLKYADYTVLLSDTEGFPYTIYESLCLGTPIIVTPLLMLDEMGVNQKNSIVLDFDMSNVDVQEIYKKAGTLKFKYDSKPDGWLELLDGESDYEYTDVTIKALSTYYDTYLGKKVVKGELSDVPEDMAQIRIDRGLAERI